jgi:hypothetical protein
MFARAKAACHRWEGASKNLASNLIEKRRESRCHPAGVSLLLGNLRETPARPGAPDRVRAVCEAQGIGLIHFLELGTYPLVEEGQVCITTICRTVFACDTHVIQ